MKNMKNLYNKNFKTLKKGIKGDIRRQIGRTKTVKMAATKSYLHIQGHTSKF